MVFVLKSKLNNNHTLNFMKANIVIITLVFGLLPFIGCIAQITILIQSILTYCHTNQKELSTKKPEFKKSAQVFEEKDRTWEAALEDLEGDMDVFITKVFKGSHGLWFNQLIPGKNNE